MVATCKTVVYYHNEDIDFDTDYLSYSDFLSFTCSQLSLLHVLSAYVHALCVLGFPMILSQVWISLTTATVKSIEQGAFL